MKNASRIGLLSLALLLGASASTDAVTPKEFWAKHKGKLIAGAAAAAAIGIGVVLGKHANKTQEAVAKAGISQSSSDYEDALAVVAFFGPLGMDRTISLLNQAIDRNYISREEASGIVVTDIGKALAIYWGVTHEAYIFAAGYSNLKRTVKKAGKKVVGAVKGFFSS